MRSPQLMHEAKVYQCLSKGVGFPRILYTGTKDMYNVIVMDLLGPNLQQLLEYCKGTFSIKTVCMIAQEALLRIEFMHKMGYVHRDIKPENILLVYENNNTVIKVTDFGLAKSVADGLHTYCGTPQYYAPEVPSC